MAGTSETPLVTELGIGPGCTVGLLNPPDDLDAILAPLPEGVRLVAGVRSHRDVVLAFFRRRTELGQKLVAMARATGPGGAIWVAWPNTASDEPTDITEDIVRAAARPAGLVDTKACAVGRVWSAVRLEFPGGLRR
jgi:hypothetical protein